MLVSPLAFVAVACTAPGGSVAGEITPQPPPTVTVASPHHGDFDLSGAWATGSTGEPSAQLITLPVQCNYSPPKWLLQQNGDTVQLWVMPAVFEQGIATRPTTSKVGAKGRVSGNDVTIDQAGARYVLRYDSTTGHLRGTLNDEPFWAVRLKILRPENCIPVP